MIDYSKLYMTIPYGRTWHVFGEDNRSLCGKAMMLRRDPYRCEDVKGTESYKKGQDCKACFKKAKLAVPTEKGKDWSG